MIRLLLWLFAVACGSRARVPRALVVGDYEPRPRDERYEHAVAHLRRHYRERMGRPRSSDGVVRYDA